MKLLNSSKLKKKNNLIKKHSVTVKLFQSKRTSEIENFFNSTVSKNWSVIDKKWIKNYKWLISQLLIFAKPMILFSKFSFSKGFFRKNMCNANALVRRRFLLGTERYQRFQKFTVYPSVHSKPSTEFGSLVLTNVRKTGIF